MDIRAQYRFIIFKLLLILPDLFAKTFSLNEAIAAEARNHQSIKIPRISDISSLKEINGAQQRFIKPRNNFLLKPPVKPKLLKTRLGSIYKTKQAKRQLDDYDEINPNFLPLFRSLSIILDNIIDSDPSELINLRNKFKRNPSFTHDKDDIVCKCAYRTTTESVGNSLSDSYEETIIPTAFSNQIETKIITSTTSTTPKTYYSSYHNIRNLGRNKNLPVLSSRNSTSFRRNSNGFNETSSTSNIKYVKRNFTRNQGNYEYDTRNRIFKSPAKNSEENTDCDTRNSGGCDKFGGNTRPHGTYFRKPCKETIDKYFSTTSRNDDGNICSHEEQDKFPDKGINGEGAELIPEFIKRSRNYPQIQIESSKTEDEKSYTSNKQFIPSTRRGISYGDSTNPTENKKNSRKDETISSLNLENPNNKVVMIYDGYSVARDVNGENKMSEKAIQIHT